MSQKKIEEILIEIKDEITHPYDGPVTRFVAMSRAMKMSHDKTHEYSLVAEAMDDLLDSFAFADDCKHDYNTSD